MRKIFLSSIDRSFSIHCVRVGHLCGNLALATLWNRISATGIIFKNGISILLLIAIIII